MPFYLYVYLFIHIFKGKNTHATSTVLKLLCFPDNSITIYVASLNYFIHPGFHKDNYYESITEKLSA